MNKRNRCIINELAEEAHRDLITFANDSINFPITFMNLIRQQTAGHVHNKVKSIVVPAVFKRVLTLK